MACFSRKSSERPKKLIPSEAFAELERWEEYYQKLLDLRDAYAAHNFGPQRMYEVIAVIDEKAGKVEAISIATGVLGGFTIYAQADLMAFCSTALKHAEARKLEAEDKVVNEVKNLTEKQVANLPDARLVIPTDKETRMSRDRYRSIFA